MRAVLHQIRLDTVAAHQFSWRLVRNNNLICRSIALENLLRAVPPFDNDKIDLLHAPFKGRTMFGIASAMLQKTNTERANAITVFPSRAGPWTTYST